MRQGLLLMFSLLLCLKGFANGKITGKVSDEKNGEFIVGAVVAVKGTPQGTVTDVDGNFSFDVAGGTYTLVVNYIGYQSKEIADVVVGADVTVEVKIALSESKATQLQDVVVRSSLKKENINALYLTQKNAATISDGISADVIKKSPDRSTGEVLKRVSGTTIQDNKFVVVRGLGDRYNIALVDNAVLPSTEPNRKAFSFDIIPSAIIDNIVISKAATPDQPGDFSGGSINVLTKEAPEEKFNSVSVGTIYNTVATGSQFKSGYKTSTDFLGFDDGSRQLPTNFPTTKKVLGGLTQQESSTALQMMNNNYDIKTSAALPGASIQGSLGRVVKWGNGSKFGFTGAVTYSHYENIKKDLVRQYDGFNYTDNVYGYSSNLGALLNGAYYVGGSKIVFKSIYNRIFDDNFLYREGTNNGSSSDVRYYAYDLVQKSLLKSSLEGEHRLGKGQSKFGWLASANIVTNNQPDQRKVSYSRFGNGDFLADNTTLGKANNRLFGDLYENIASASAYYSMPFELFNNKSSLKVGVFEQYRYRDFHNRYLGAVLNINAAGGESVRQRAIGTLYGNDLIEKSAYRIEEITGPGDQYNATATTTAGYAMLDNKLTDRIRLVWGSRFESYGLNLQAGDGTNVQPVWNDLLPSANFTYSLNNKSNLRASYFRSVARPELREVAPLSYYDYELNATIQGNTSLSRSRIDNIDVRYEIYPGAGEVLSTSVFYKHFDNTIENNVNGQNSSYEINPMNYKAARNIGWEAEFRKNLGFLRPNSVFKNLNFYANFAYINSQVQLDTVAFANGHEYTTRPLSGQSPYMVNASLSYSALEGKLNFNVLYNRIGQRIFLIGQGRFGNVYESARNLFDFQANYCITKNSEIKFTIKDLFNNPIRLYFDQNNSGRFEKQDVTSGAIDPEHDWIYSQYKPGSTFTLMYICKF
jgi:hypothetical protein